MMRPNDAGQVAMVEACARAYCEARRACELARGNEAPEAWDRLKEDERDLFRQPVRLMLLEGLEPRGAYERDVEAWRVKGVTLEPYSDLPPRKHVDDDLFVAIVVSVAIAIEKSDLVRAEAVPPVECATCGALNPPAFTFCFACKTEPTSPAASPFAVDPSAVDYETRLALEDGAVVTQIEAAPEVAPPAGFISEPPPPPAAAPAPSVPPPAPERRRR